MIDFLASLTLEPDIPKVYKFTKYPNTARELRSHVLTYLNKKTLQNYAACSKLCNSEIQKYNTIAPGEIDLRDVPDGYEMEFRYYRPKSERFMGSAKLTFAHSESSKVNELRVLEFYKHVKRGKTHKLDVKMKKWPTEIMSLKPFTEIPKWFVILYDSMFNDFLNFIEKGENQIRHLMLFRWGNPNMTLPPSFFKTSTFKNLQVADFELTCQIDNDDFVNLQTQYVDMFSNSVSFDAIREKVDKMNENGDEQHIKIMLPKNTPFVFNFDELFNRERFPKLRRNMEGYWQIGNVQVRTKSHYVEMSTAE